VIFFGLLLLFFGLFFVAPPSEEANSAIFRYFLLIFGLFFRWLPLLENFLSTPLARAAANDTELELCDHVDVTFSIYISDILPG